MAQTGAALRDSLQAKMNLMRELVQPDNFEDAQVEAGNYRDFLKRNVIYFPPAGLVMISNIYWHNKDKKGAEPMLREAEQDALRDKNLKSRQALLKTIIKAHERWENEERVQICRQILQTTEDSLAARQVKDQTVHLERQIDSLQTALQQEEERVAEGRAEEVGKISELLLLPEERTVVKLLHQFPAVLNEAALRLDPSSVANHAYELVKAYNSFYQTVPVLKEEDKAKRDQRLKLSEICS